MATTKDMVVMELAGEAVMQDHVPIASLAMGSLASVVVEGDFQVAAQEQDQHLVRIIFVLREKS